MNERYDGEYLWGTMWGTYYAPMLVIQFGTETSEIMFWDDIAENYECRYVHNDLLRLADGPGTMQ